MKGQLEMVLHKGQVSDKRFTCGVSPLGTKEKVEEDVWNEMLYYSNFVEVYCKVKGQ